MRPEIVRIENTLRLKLLHPRLDGANAVIDGLSAAFDSGAVELSGVDVVEVDFLLVEYMNSLGITELVNVYRAINARSKGKLRFRFSNVREKIRAILTLVELDRIVDVTS